LEKILIEFKNLSIAEFNCFQKSAQKIENKVFPQKCRFKKRKKIFSFRITFENKVHFAKRK